MAEDETKTVESIVSNFNSREFTKDKTKLNNFVDVTDALANSGLQIGFEHVPTGKTINFKAYITAFNETFSSDWATETVFGRIDPIAMFKQTTRNVTLSFKVVAATPSEGFENLYRVDVLRSFLYPTYASTGDKEDNAITLAQSPLVRVKVMNMLTDGAESNTYDQVFGTGLMTAMDGALSIIKSMSVAHNLDNTDVGVFHPGTSGQTPVSETDAKLAELGLAGIDGPQPTSVTGVIPKMMEISMDFTVLHEKNMGWRKNKTNHVYGIDMEKTINPDPEPEPMPTQFDSATPDSAASQASKDSRIAQWAQGVRARREGRQRIEQAREYDASVQRIRENFDSEMRELATATLTDAAHRGTTSDMSTEALLYGAGLGNLNHTEFDFGDEYDFDADWDY